MLIKRQLLLVVGASIVILGLSLVLHAKRVAMERSVAERGEPLRFEQPSPTPIPAPECATILFGGDMMFDRHIRQKAQAVGNYDFIFRDLEPLLKSADLVVANLEGPVTDFPSRSVGSEVGSTDNYFFTFEPKAILDSLSRWPFVVNLGNNHISNFGAEGLLQTKSYLLKAKLGFFGYTVPGQQEETTWQTSVNGLRIAFVNYNQFVVGGLEQSLLDIAESRTSADVVVVYTHWGNEYVPENDVQRNLAHQFVDAGADLVIGSHPHVVQSMEDYAGKRIYYSLGNFVFDQYFEEAVQNGLLVESTVCRSPETQLLEWNFMEYPIQLNLDGSTTL